MTTPPCGGVRCRLSKIALLAGEFKLDEVSARRAALYPTLINAAAFALLLVFVQAFGRGGGRKIDNSTRLAAERNRLALERTLMAWVRTAISLITLGTGFYKAGQLIGPTSPVHPAWLRPRQFGLT